MKIVTRPDRLLTRGYEPQIRCAGHLSLGLNPARLYETLHHILRVLRHHDFDAIAFRGLSGALFAPTVAMQMGKTLLAVRKSSNCHSSQVVEGDYNAKRYVILDDFASSGETVRNIVKEIYEVMPNAICIGLCEYMYLNNTEPCPLRSVKEIITPWASPVEKKEPGIVIRRVTAKPAIA